MVLGIDCFDDIKHNYFRNQKKEITMNNIEQVKILQKDLKGIDLKDFHSTSAELGVHFGTYNYYHEAGTFSSHPNEAACVINIRRSDLPSKQASQKKWDEFFAKHIKSLTEIRFKN